MSPSTPYDGIFELKSDVYHADPCLAPSLSRSLAHIICTQTPLHAKMAHPRLNPDFVRVEKTDFDIGTAAHALFLEGVDKAVVIDAADWKKPANREERDAARAAGMIPLLIGQWDRVQAMVEAIRPQLNAVDATPGLFVDGVPEQALVWQEDGVWCRALCDWLHDDHTAIDDYKTTGGSANPENWSLHTYGYDMQAAFYLRGLRAISDADAEFRFVVQETSPPYLLAVVSPSPDVLALAEAKVEYAIRVWRECLEADSWPGYPKRICHVELPPWEEPRWMEKLAREGIV